MTHDELKSLLALAALDRLEPEEEASLQAHLGGGCAQCEAELRELREAAAALAMTVDPPTSENRVASKIAARLAASAHTQGTDRPPSRTVDRGRRATVRRPAQIALAAGIILAVYGATVTVRLFRSENAYQDRLGNFEHRISSLEAQAEKASAKADELSKLLSEQVQLERVLESPDAEITRLAPLGLGSGARAIVVLSMQMHVAVIEAERLPATPAGKTYELWWITKESGSVPAGLFRAETGREVVARVNPPPTGQHVTRSAVTLEPAGGAKKLTGTMYLKG